VTALLVVAGAAVGAPLRHLADVLVRWWLRADDDDPVVWGTLLVNLAGSAVIGVLAGATAGGGPGAVTALVGTGFCGALTTFSTLSLETVRLLERGRVVAGLGYAVGSLAAGTALCWAGWALARWSV
jgi:fluoride exporter